ncbi:MAG: hypothetical protein HY716_18385 [Planctomycetes bacterium]|nr:hypothetical protein [Planctomycetota bacterium]
MKTGLAVVWIVAAGLMMGAEARAQDGSFGVKWRRWTAKIDGDVRTEDSSQDLQVDSTLGLTDREDFNEFHLFLNLPAVGSFNFQILSGDFQGRRLLESDVTFGGTTFPANTTIESEIDVTSYTLLWQFGLDTPGVLYGRAGLGIVAGLKYIQAEALLRTEDGREASPDVKVPMPVIGVYGRLFLASFLSIEAQIHGVRISNFPKDVSGLLFDATIGFTARYKALSGGLGYRLYRIAFEDKRGDVADQISADVDLTGLFFEVGLAF